MSRRATSITSSEGRSCRRGRSRGSCHATTTRRKEEAATDDSTRGQLPPPSDAGQQLPLTQGDIPKIVELIVKQLPTPKGTTEATTATIRRLPNAADQMPQIAEDITQINTPISGNTPSLSSVPSLVSQSELVSSTISPSPTATSSATWAVPRKCKILLLINN